MVVVVIHIPQQYRCVVKAVDHHVNLTVVEQISEGCTTRRNHISQARSFYSGHNLEFLAMVQVMKQQRSLRKRCTPVMLIHLRIHGTAHKHQVFPSIIVVIEKLSAPAQKWISAFGDTHLRSDIDEVPISVIAIERLIDRKSTRLNSSHLGISYAV